MMQIYQEGLLTLQKLRTGGKQTVVVQHVQVSDGGQAVIAGSMAILGRTTCLARGAFQELLAQEPESAMYLRDSTVDLRNLGDVSVKQKRLKEARRYYTSAMAIDRRLVERDPADRDTQLYLQAAQKIHQERTKVDPANADAKDLLASNYVLIGDAYATLARSTSESLRHINLQNGCTAYNHALSIWNAMRAAGALNKLSEKHRSSLLVKIQNCN
jgi:tetratricopeptide (TPR) repeat protein